jgi:hypothetical protein
MATVIEQPHGGLLHLLRVLHNLKALACVLNHFQFHVATPYLDCLHHDRGQGFKTASY